MAQSPQSVFPTREMQTFNPFPLRARGSLEIFDAAIKLYKQYFWVLLGWSAIVAGASVFGSILPFGGMAAMFITPLAIGSVVCCLAASVRGQNVEFGQCWRFTQPRYWMMLGMHLLASLIGSLVIVVLLAVSVGVVVAGVFAFRESSGLVQAVMATLAFVVLGTVMTIVGTVFFTWMGLVPIVICMEEDKRGTTALGRAYDILRGHWLRITTLMALVGLGMLALLAILGGLAALAVGVGRIGELMQGRGVDDAMVWVGIAAMGLAYTILWIVWTPLYYLILAVFYLDVRVRQEALDLEWTAHTTAPPAPLQETFAAAPMETAYPAPLGSQSSLEPQTYTQRSEYSDPAAPSLAAEPAPNAFGTRPLNADPLVPANFASPSTLPENIPNTEPDFSVPQSGPAASSDSSSLSPPDRPAQQ